MSTGSLNPPAPPTSPPPTTTTTSASSSASVPAPASVSVSASVPVQVQTPVQTSTNHHLHPSLNSEPQRTVLPPPHHDSRLYNSQTNQQQPPPPPSDHKPDHLHQHQQQQQQQHPNHHHQQHHDQSFHPDHHHQQHHHPNHHIDQKPQLTDSGNSSIYESNYLHLPSPHSNMNSQSHPNCFASNEHQTNGNNNNHERLNHHHNNNTNNNKLGTRNTISPSLSHRSTPTPSPTSSPSSPPFYNTNNGNILDLNSIVSYSQLIQRREEVVAALKYRSGDHYAQQALDLLKAGRERVKRITAAGRAATGKPPVKHIQEQYLAVFSRFSEYCASQNIPTWPIEPVRVAIWVLAMQEKAPPTPATLRQYITRLEFTCTVTASLFDNEFGPSSPLKASALLRELVNRDLPGQNKLKPSKGLKSNKRSRSQTDGSITPPSSKKWQPNHPSSAPGGGAEQHSQHDYAISEHQQQHQHHHHPHHHHPQHYESYLSPFGTPATPYHPSPLGSSQPHHPHEIWPPHHPRYTTTGPNTEPISSYHHHHHPHLAHHQRNEPQRTYPNFVSQAGPSTSFVAPSTSTTPTTTTTPTSAAPASQSDPRYSHAAVESNPWV
ncbi:hypothetical protein DFH28DRAFT_1127959 [Melampsora americana]|nr:hypothetical protein DFH28DRAFT_1127959 [Melampsora americana]